MQVRNCHLGFGTAVAGFEAALDGGLASIDIFAGPGYADSVTQVDTAATAVHGALSLAGLASAGINWCGNERVDKRDLVLAAAEGAKATGYALHMCGSPLLGIAAIGLGTLGTVALGIYSDR